MTVRRPNPLHGVSDLDSYVLWSEFQPASSDLHLEGGRPRIQERNECCTTDDQREFKFHSHSVRDAEGFCGDEKKDFVTILLRRNS